MSDSIEPLARLTMRQFVMEARQHASEQAEHGGHRWHLILQILLFAIVVASLGFGYELHINELFFVAGGTVVIMLVSYAHSRFFSGYYAIYSTEWDRANEERQRADQLTVERDRIAIERDQSLAREMEMTIAVGKVHIQQSDLAQQVAALQETFAKENVKLTLDVVKEFLYNLQTWDALCKEWRGKTPRELAEHKPSATGGGSARFLATQLLDAIAMRGPVIVRFVAQHGLNSQIVNDWINAQFSQADDERAKSTCDEVRRIVDHALTLAGLPIPIPPMESQSAAQGA